MGKGMAKWWDRKWRLVIAAILLPILLVPIINIFLFPETPLTQSLLYGAIFSLFVLFAFRILQHIEQLGLRVVILVLVGAALLILLLIFVYRIWDPRVGILVTAGWALLVLLLEFVFMRASQRFVPFTCFVLSRIITPLFIL
jgi:hypothetical protein